MHRLPVPTELIALDEVTLPREAARHLKVLRPKLGEEIELFDGRGRMRRYAVAGALLKAVAAAESVERPASQLVLFACVTKGGRWDWTVEKAVELGVTRIVPVLSDRVIVRLPPEEREDKAERWRRVAMDAARQSAAAWLPEILAPIDFRDTIAMVRETTCFVGALTNPPPPPLWKVVAESGVGAGGSCAVYVGPEGDFTPDELSALLEIARPASFGPSVLRAETAAIFAVSVCRSFLDR